MKRISTALLPVMAALAALAAAPSAYAATVSGVVVHNNFGAHSFVVADRTGKLIAVHARALPTVGRVSKVRARKLRNGTWLARKIRLGGAATRVNLRGTVTFVNHRRHEFALSARGTSLLVHERLGRARRAHPASDAELTVGENVAVQATVEDSSVSATEIDPKGQDPNGLDLEGVVENVDDSTRTVTLSADDSERSGATVKVEVPASFDLSGFTRGEEVELIVSPGLDDMFTLEQASDDSGSHHADNPGENQGDEHGDEHASAEQQCAAQQADPSFPSSHNGLSFTQFYERDPSDANNAFGRCVNAKAQEQEAPESSSGEPAAGSGETESGSGTSGSSSTEPGTTGATGPTGSDDSSSGAHH